MALFHAEVTLELDDSKLSNRAPPRKLDVPSNSLVGDISVVTLIRPDDGTLDHSQKAEKVYMRRETMKIHARIEYT